MRKGRELSVGSIKGSSSSYSQRYIRPNKILQMWLSSTKPPLSPDDECKLIEEYKRTGDKKVREEIIMRNQRFIFSCAKIYSSDTNIILELISEGSIGMLEALERFDLSIGVKFYSFAVWYIKRNMIEYLAKNSLVKKRLPPTLACYIKKVKEDWVKENCGTLGNVPEEYIQEKVLERFEKKMSIEVLRDISVSSMDSLQESEEGKHQYNKISELIANRNNCEKELEQEDNEKTVEKMINAVSFNQLEHDILCHFWGVLGYEQLTIESLSTKFGINHRTMDYLQRKLRNRLIRYARTGYICGPRNNSKYQDNNN